MPNLARQKIYEFEGFRLDAAHLLLYRDGAEIPLTPKTVETLLVLVENRGRVISKDELMRRVWADAAVEENNLSQNLFRLRKVLGEKTAEGKPFIETLRRRGYRFVPEVRVAETAPRAAGPSDDGATESRGDSGFEPQGAPLAPAPDDQHQESMRVNGAGISERENPPPRDLSLRASYPRPNPKIAVRPGWVIALLCAAASGLAVFFAFKEMRSTPSLWNPKAISSLKRLTERGNTRGVAISPDGNNFAYVLVEGNYFSLRLKNILTESELVLIPPTTTWLGGPRFSPDGNFLFYSSLQDIYRIPVLGGETRRVASDAWSNFSVSPDGKWLAFPRHRPKEDRTLIVVAASDGSGERVAAEKSGNEYFVAWGPAPVFTPDGGHLTVVTGKHGIGQMYLADVDLQTGAERELPTRADWEIIDYLDWASERELIISAREKGGVKIQIWSLVLPEGAAERVTNDFNAYPDFSLSGDKTKILATQETENLHLWMFDRKTGAARQVTSGTSRANGRNGLALMPDAGRIIFVARDKNNYDIFSVAADGTDLRQLTKNAGSRNVDPAVSPDGRLIAFISDRTGAIRLWVMNAADGSGARQLTPVSTEKERVERAPYFSPDGRWVYYVLDQNGKGAIRKISVDGAESVPVSAMDKNVFEPVASPDGKFLTYAVFVDEAASRWQIGLMSLENPSEPDRFFNFPAYRLRPRWTSDSKSLVAIDDQAGGFNLWETNLETGERKPVTSFTSEKIYRFDAAADGRHYVLARGEYLYDAVLLER